jgi:ankyrin repeat protein
MVAAGLATRSPGEDAGTESEVLEAVQAALDLGADINAVDNNGETAMHAAAYKNLPRVVKYLATKGARIDVWNRNDKFGWTPLAIAVGYRFGNFAVCRDGAAIREVMIAAGVTPPRRLSRGPLADWPNLKFSGVSSAVRPNFAVATACAPAATLRHITSIRAPAVSGREIQPSTLTLRPPGDRQRCRGG